MLDTTLADVPYKQIETGDHAAYMKHALTLAQQSPPQPTNFCVGALIVDPTPNPPSHAPNSNILSTGFTLEMPGNTHAEQCCISKLMSAHGFEYSDAVDCVETEKEFVRSMREGRNRSVALYTTMEPCSKRNSGNRSCADRIVALRGWITKVYVGVREPEIFVGANEGRKKLEEAGIEVVAVEGLEEEILRVAKAGHGKKDSEL